MKNLFVVLFVLQAFSLFGQNASDFEYEVNGTGNSQTITITGYNGDLKSIRIPEQINNIPVTIIGDSAFFNKGLTGVLLPVSLQSIGNSAFSNNRLTEIFISPNVTFVGRAAFLNNPLQRIIIGKNVTLEVGLLPDLPDIWEQFVAHYNNSGKQSGIYNTQ